MVSLLNYEPAAMQPIKTRAQKMAELTAEREAERVKKRAANARAAEMRKIEEAARLIGNPSVKEGANPTNNTSYPGSLETDQFQNPAVLGFMGSMFGIPGAATVGMQFGASMANNRLDELVDPTISNARLNTPLDNPFGRNTSFSGLMGLDAFNVGRDFGVALDARTAQLDPLSTDFTYADPVAAWDGAFSLDTAFGDLVDAAYDRNPDLAQYTDDFMQDAYGLGPTSGVMSYDDLMTYGGMSQPGQQFDNLADLGPRGQWDFSDIDEFGNPTPSYNSFGDWMADLFGLETTEEESTEVDMETSLDNTDDEQAAEDGLNESDFDGNDTDPGDPF